MFRARSASGSLRRRLVTGVLIAGLLPLMLGIGLVAWRSSADNSELLALAVLVVSLLSVQ